VSVDTYLKGKNLGRYQRVSYGDVEVLIAPTLPRWAAEVRLDVKKFLFWKSFDVTAEHAHGPT
jgi:hypothetical protein